MNDSSKLLRDKMDAIAKAITTSIGDLIVDHPIQMDGRLTPLKKHSYSLTDRTDDYSRLVSEEIRGKMKYTNSRMQQRAQMPTIGKKRNRKG